jgi:hypothetical protein
MAPEAGHGQHQHRFEGDIRGKGTIDGATNIGEIIEKYLQKARRVDEVRLAGAKDAGASSRIWCASPAGGPYPDVKVQDSSESDEFAVALALIEVEVGRFILRMPRLLNHISRSLS